MFFYLWSNKYNKWWRERARGYTEDTADRGVFDGADAMRYMIYGTDDLEWMRDHEEPKTLALSLDGRWYSLVEYDGDVPPDEPTAARPSKEELRVADASAVRDDDLEEAA